MTPPTRIATCPTCRQPTIVVRLNDQWQCRWCDTIVPIEDE